MVARNVADGERCADRLSLCPGRPTFFETPAWGFDMGIGCLLGVWIGG